MGVTYRGVFTGKREVVVNDVGVDPDVRLGAGRDPSSVPPQAVQAALDPAGVGPLPPGPSPTEGLIPADELKRRVEPVLLRAGDAEKAEDQVEKGDLAIDTYQYYSSDYPSLTAGSRAGRSAGLAGHLRALDRGHLPAPFAVSVSIYKDGDGAHKDLREIYEPGEPAQPAPVEGSRADRPSWATRRWPRSAPTTTRGASGCPGGAAAWSTPSRAT